MYIVYLLSALNSSLFTIVMMFVCYRARNCRL